jgi:hypothetical protein
MAKNLRFQVDLQDGRATAQKTKTVWRRLLREMPLRDTLRPVEALQRP